MKPNYYEIYSEIRVIYRNQFEGNPYPFRRFQSEDASQLDFLDRVIFEAEAKIGKRLRPDARVFLLANFHLMVLMPLSHRLASDSPEEIKEAIQQDIRQIVESAASHSKDQPDISGGAILRATTGLWEKLKTNAQNIWT